ncbi:hypothetical protein QYF36_007477 [Acer negundo]|nr:hypothetical protein QYF36_007477 [Acer negundo]
MNKRGINDHIRMDSPTLHFHKVPYVTTLGLQPKEIIFLRSRVASIILPSLQRPLIKQLKVTTIGNSRSQAWFESFDLESGCEVVKSLDIDKTPFLGIEAFDTDSRVALKAVIFKTLWGLREKLLADEVEISRLQAEEVEITSCLRELGLIGG